MAVSLVLAVACGKDEGNSPLNPNAIKLTPNKGIGGDLITIEGAAFSSTKTSNEVKFNGRYGLVIEASANKLTVAVPQGVTTGKVVVHTQSSSERISRESTTDFTVDASQPLIGCGPRLNAATFIIGPKAYVVAGRQSSAILKKDVWEYDSQTKTWTKKADYPFGEIEGAFGFSINGKGYVGGGVGFNSNSAFYEYDPASNTWTRKADLYVTANPVTFVINGKGYVATGGQGNFSAGSKLLEYDPVTNSWTERAPFPGPARSSAAGFVINNKSYLGTGFDSKMLPLKDFYEYDPASNTWTRKADFAGVDRYASVGFAIGTKGYIGTGFNRDFLNDVWSYNPSTNQWQQESSLQAAPRSHAMTFTLANTVIILGGINELYSMDDLREYR